MTDSKPTTITLNTDEWRALLAANLAHAAQFAQAKAVISLDELRAVHEHFDRMKSIATAWHFSPPPMAQEAPGQAAASDAAPTTNAHDAAPKRKGGWPKGRSRKRGSGAEVVQ